jgi:prepilin-type N-terminal cleavage/methylation domain-containing protein
MRSSRSRTGFTLIEVLVAMTVLAVAISGSLAVIYSAGQTARRVRQRNMALLTARVALADAHYAFRDDLDGINYIYAADPLGPEGFQRAGHIYQSDSSYGWVWRAHTFDDVLGLYAVDVWVFIEPDSWLFKYPGPTPDWSNQAALSDFEKSTLLFLRSSMGVRP